MDIINNNIVNGAVESLQGGRQENQDDYHFCETPLGFLLVVCDGMGGGPGGKMASYMAKTAISDTLINCPPDFNREDAVKLAIENANEAIFTHVKNVPELKGMGTTALVLLLNEESVVLGHVGDSRIYKIRNGSVCYRSQDHSMVGELVRNKTLTEEQARLSSQSNILTRAVGVRETVEVDVETVAFEKGDRFILCSDGIWGTMPQKDLVKEFSVKKQISVLVENLAHKIDEMGKKKGNHHDNLTVAMIETSIDSKLKETMSRRTRYIIIAIFAVALISIIANFVLIGKNSSLSKYKEQTEQLQEENAKKDASINELNTKLSNAQQEAQVSKNSSSFTATQLQNEIQRLKDENNQLKGKIEGLQANTQKPVVSANNNSSSQQTNNAQQLKQKAIDALSALAKLYPIPSNITQTRRTEFNRAKAAAFNALKAANRNDLSAKINTVKYCGNGEQNTINEILKKIK